MKILVIEDNEIHAEAARVQLEGDGHTVTVVKDYDSAVKEIKNLSAGFTYEEIRTLKKEGLSERERGSKERQRIRDKFPYDVVLTDLLMPCGKSPREWSGKEQDLGIYLAIAAGMNGAKYVGLLTDTGHHDHPASAALDLFYRRLQCGDPEVLNICGARTLLINCGFLTREGDTYVKNWRGVLQLLLEEG